MNGSHRSPLPTCFGSSRTGFSLIEIILTLIIIGMAAAMIVPYFMSGVFDSATVVNRQETIFNLNGVMANMVAEYEANYTNNLTGLSSAIGSAGSSSSAFGNVGSTTVTYVVKSKDFVDIAGGTNNGLEVVIADPKDEIRLYYLFAAKREAP
jgi:prepilin-type N-terminal cleavage/methylation domain-containing protein